MLLSLSCHFVRGIFLLFDCSTFYLCREMDLLLVPYWADRDLELIQWPPFLLASKVVLHHFYHSNLILPSDRKTLVNSIFLLAISKKSYFPLFSRHLESLLAK